MALCLLELEDQGNPQYYSTNFPIAQYKGFCDTKLMVP